MSDDLSTVNTSTITTIKELTLISIIQQKLGEFIGEALDQIAIVFLIYAISCLILYKLIFHRLGKYFIKTNRLPECKRVLLVTAHPDDESMFFGPTILALRRRNCRLFVLCLSHGNHDRKGEIRRLELWDACEYLEILPSDVTLMNITHLQDDPAIEWKTTLIATQILKQVESLDIQVLITFDKDGISNHPNHCAIYYAAGKKSQ